MMRKLVILTFIVLLYYNSLCAHRAYGADADTWKFAIIGDTRGDPTNPPDNGVSTNLAAIAAKMALLGPKAVFANGDLIDGDELRRLLDTAKPMTEKGCVAEGLAE